ncbi:MAG: hypothetical protein LRY55_10595 [Leadbetterella sp.]|nr:hypothetical protein [Leadbetterella sp.]
MHEIEPFYSWGRYYLPYEDKKGPFYGKEQASTYENAVYGYVIHPDWDFIGSETLYVKLLMVNYTLKYAVIELMGEWNDTLHNDIMYLKRSVVDRLLKNGIRQFILVGENLFQFHGGDSDYYEEWFEDVEDGWIALLNLRKFVMEEIEKYKLDYYMHFGGTLQMENWRTLKPDVFFSLVSALIRRRLA